MGDAKERGGTMIDLHCHSTFSDGSLTPEELVAEAELIARENGRSSIRITSGVGVRGYYRMLGYELSRPYMVKRL